MENLDVFESVFKRALRESFRYEAIAVSKILLVTDLQGEACSAYGDKAKSFLRGTGVGGEGRWAALHDADYRDWPELAAKIAAEKPSLIVTYRLLTENHEDKKFSLGAYVDTMTQATNIPVLILPNPSAELPESCERVAAVTNHLSGDQRLVNYAAALPPEEGELFLCHLEDRDTFDYYMAAIERVPEINSAAARELITEELLAAPRKYIETVEKVLKSERPGIRVRRVVEIGYLIESYRKLLRERRVDLLVCGAKDETQLAMHCVGRSLAVEFKRTPMLLI